MNQQVQRYIVERQNNSPNWALVLVAYLMALLTTFGLVLLLDEFRYQRAMNKAEENLRQYDEKMGEAATQIRDATKRAR